MSPLTIKAQSLKFKSKTPWSTAEEQKTKKIQEGHLEEGKVAKPVKCTKSNKAKQNGKEEQDGLKTKAKAQNKHSP
jgi:hypothetical protein